MRSMPSPLSRLALTIVATLAVVLASARAKARPPQRVGAGEDRPRMVPAPPMPPTGRAPVEFFMELLAASPARREQLLDGKSSEARTLIQRRLAVFERMGPGERAEAEWQLRLAQFRFYLTSLMSLPPGQRADRLQQAPEADRPLLVERLKAWDALDTASREQVLEGHVQFQYFIAHPSADPALLARVLGEAPVASRPGIEAQFARWRALPEAERRVRSAAFQAMFDLPAERRADAMKTLGERERQSMERILARFGNLPAEERDRCIAGLDRLARMAPAEREAFLRNATLWQGMSQAERDQWRRLVLGRPMPPLPTLREPAGVVTNH